jgi:hypothetical protein
MIAVSVPSSVGCRITFQGVFDLTNRVNHDESWTHATHLRRHWRRSYRAAAPDARHPRRAACVAPRPPLGMDTRRRMR